MKVCNKCKQELDINEFHKHPGTKDGHQTFCKKCQLDYQRKRFNCIPRRIVKDGYKYCPGCELELPINMFGLSVSRGDSLTDYCKICKHNRYMNPTLEKNHANRATNIRAKYNLSWEQYTDTFAEQNGKCAICNTNMYLNAKDRNKTACIDHKHETGKVRGLLCGKCNRGLGNFEDDKELLQNAITYLGE